MYEEGIHIDIDPLVIKDYVKKLPQTTGFLEFATTFDQDCWRPIPIA